VDGAWERVPLKDRDDLPPDVAALFTVRRHRGNPWTERDALVVARFAGYTPAHQWPGQVGLAWPGLCDLGHPCSPTFANVLAGRRPCGKPGHLPEVRRPITRTKISPKAKAKANIESVNRLAKERGDQIMETGHRDVKAGKIGSLKILCLTVKYPCGHTSRDLGVKAETYKSGKGGCWTCQPRRLLPGNELATLRPDLAAEIVDKSILPTLAHRSAKRVRWRCLTCNLEWETAVTNRSVLGSGCPSCTEQFGYDESLPGMLYIVHGVSRTTREVIIKVGITNNAKNRLYTHKRRGLNTILASLTWSDGTVAPTTERYWLQKIRRSLPPYLLPTKADLVDGHTEAVIDSEESRAAIAELLDFARSYSPETLTDQFLAVDLRGAG
jgi:hypothetical protein